MSNLTEREHFKLHPDDEGVDRIEIDVVPRFKTSGLSGDEWRVSARLRVYRKGELVGEKSYTSMEAVACFLPFLWKTLSDWTEGPLYSGERGGKCQQAGCAHPATVTYRLKREYSARGEGPLPPNVLGMPLRRFCAAHATRGDCALEDADENYELLSGTPDRADIPLKDISPSARVDVKVPRIEDAPEAVRRAGDEFRKGQS